MADVTKHTPGTFSWADLATTDGAAAKAFYTGLFGWNATDVPASETSVYTMLEQGEKSVCALYEMGPQMRTQGVPPHWVSYITVEDVEASANKASNLGGIVIQPPFDVTNSGRMAIVQDPTGATFALWQPRDHIGAELLGEPGALCWNELYTKDVEGAAKFYSGLFSWTVNKTKNATGGEYNEFKMGERSVGGMMYIEEEWGEVPPNWSIYLQVEDCDASLEKAKTLGGKVEFEPMEVQGMRFALVVDPQGAYFLVIQMQQTG